MNLSDSDHRGIGSPKARKAAQYVRMSTDHQRYSTENQSDAIARYADERGYQIIETYTDAGKSGLRIEGRDGLTQLLSDIQAGRTDFKTVLVYDISRWGRFQDIDLSAQFSAARSFSWWGRISAGRRRRFTWPPSTACFCSAAFRNQSTAKAKSWSTPRPL